MTLGKSQRYTGWEESTLHPIGWLPQQELVTRFYPSAMRLAVLCLCMNYYVVICLSNVLSAAEYNRPTGAVSQFRQMVPIALCTSHHACSNISEYLHQPTSTTPYDTGLLMTAVCIFTLGSSPVTAVDTWSGLQNTANIYPSLTLKSWISLKTTAKVPKRHQG